MIDYDCKKCNHSPVCVWMNGNEPEGTCPYYEPEDQRTGLVYLLGGNEIKFVEYNDIFCGACPMCKGTGEI